MRTFALLALLGAPLGAQATLSVPADFATIQEALDAALPGDTVQVAAGVYHENVDLREDVVLAGAGWRRTIIDGGGTGDVLTADGIHNFTVTGLTVRGSKTVGGNPGAGIYIHGDSATTFGVTALIDRCRVLENGDGIRVTNVHTGVLTITKNTIDRNARHGIDVFLGTTAITSNTIADNGGSGILATDGGGFVNLRGNAIYANGGHAVLRSPTMPMTIAYNDVYGNAGGGYYELVAGQPKLFAPSPGTGELTVEPGFYGSEVGDYHLTLGSPLINASDPALGLDPDGSNPDIGAFTYNAFYTPSSVAFGTGCGPVSSWFWEPILGQSYFEARVLQAPAMAPALLLLGVNNLLWSGLPLPFDLGFFGATGCELLTGPILNFPTATDGDGAAKFKLKVPQDPALAGAVIYLEWMVSSPGTNPLGFVFSDGVASTIKP